MKRGITAGGDFCKVLRSTKGQQVLLKLEMENDLPILVYYSTFVVDGQPCLVGLNSGLKADACLGMVTSPLTAQQEFLVADTCLQRLEHYLQTNGVDPLLFS